MPIRSSLCALTAALTLATGANAAEVVTSFEFFDTDGEFTLGTSPTSVTFLNGLAQSVGNFSLYASGFNSWMIPAGATGTVEFETPAASVSLFFRDQFASNDGVLTFFDTNGLVVATFNATTAFQNITVESPTKGAPIGSMTLENNGASGFSVIDDFIYCAIGGGVVPIDDPIPGPIPASPTHVRLVEVATGLIAPNWGAFAPLPPVPGAASLGALSANDRLFVNDQVGVLWAIDLQADPPDNKSVFLDVSHRLVTLGIGGPGTFDERGFLGFAFHPDYANNGKLYTFTSEPAIAQTDFPLPVPAAVNHQSVVIEWIVPDPTSAASVVDPASARVLIRLDEPQFNHNAGALVFGPDGMLYISIGDGGAGDDQGAGHSPGGNGQNFSTVLGSILRIDPLGSNSSNGAYGIPANNPFLTDAKIPNEIFRKGLRNPFRISFDMTGEAFFIADVGQNDIEEVNREPLPFQTQSGGLLAGKNFGWPIKEGTFLFDMNGADAGFVSEDSPGLPAGLTDPVAQYDHDEGLSAIGGFVYRGSRIPSLVGRYIFGDFSQTFASDGRLFHLSADDQVLEFQLIGQAAVNRSVLGFGQGADGEVYLLGNSTGVPFPAPNGSPTGVVLRIEPKAGDLNADGVVNGSDLASLLANWGLCSGGNPCAADLNGDGVVNGSDLASLLANWG